MEQPNSKINPVRSSVRSAQGESLPVDSSAFHHIAKQINEAVEDGVFPGSVLLIAREGQVIFHRSFGKKWIRSSAELPEPPAMSFDTVFDIGTLTGPVAVTALCMRLIENGSLALTDRVSNFLEGFGVHGKSVITISHLLSHTAGLAPTMTAHDDLRRENSGARLGILTSKGARDFVITSINRSHLKSEPGTKLQVSEVGYMLLGHIIELVTGVSLDKALFKHVLQPLGLKSTSFIDLGLMKQRGLKAVTDVIAPTEHCAWRGRLLWGEVQDDNAWAMGGIAGHAGLFSTAFDLHILARELIVALRGASHFLKRETVAAFLNAPATAGSTAIAGLGFEQATRDNGMDGIGFSPRTVGANGSTGCSLWIDIERGVELILMSNRVNPSRKNVKISSFRTSLFKEIMVTVSR